MVTRRINIVALSDERITLRHREGSSMLDLKEKMLEKVFKDTLSKRRLTLVKEEKDVGVRFFWDGYRGILCIKNQHSEIREFKISIFNEKAMDVFFENERD